MALSTYVKISTVTNLSDARYCAGMGVDAIGFRLEEGQPGYVSPTVFHGITEWLAGVALVGEFLGADASVISKIAKEYPLDYVQVDNVGLLPELQGLSAKLILRLDPAQLSDIEDLTAHLTPFAQQVDWILIEPEEEYENGDLFSKVKSLSLPVVLGFGIETNNTDAFPAAIKGIALKGGEEERPGFRDYEELMDILEALEVED